MNSRSPKLIVEPRTLRTKTVISTEKNKEAIYQSSKQRLTNSSRLLFSLSKPTMASIEESPPAQ